MTTTKVQGDELATLKISIKHPKEERLLAGIVIDVFEVKGNGNWMCPVQAWRSWNKDKVFVSSAVKPAIRLANGQAYTGKDFNKDLKSLLQGSSHSFRSSLATWMSKVKYSNEEIMAICRWHSSAFLKYIKASREKRALLVIELNKRVHASIQLK